MKNITMALALIVMAGFVKYREKGEANSDGQVSNDMIKTRLISCFENAPVNAMGTEPWTDKQLMAPADLAAIIHSANGKKPMIYSVGPAAPIKGSVDLGPAKEKENLEKLKIQLNKSSRDAYIVIYCGCCPFEHCPNIRPAFRLLNEMKFTNAHLLNLEHNIKTDWVSKGYPQ